jgi:hypothetical protein
MKIEMQKGPVIEATKIRDLIHLIEIKVVNSNLLM